MNREQKRPEKLTYHICNDVGFIVEKKCRLPELKCYEENGSVLFWASVLDTRDREEEIEVLQYLTPHQRQDSLRVYGCFLA